MIKQIFVRNGEKFVMAGNKIKLFKKDLAEKVNLSISEIEIIHNCIILENYQMIKHYNIPFDVEIWFGKLSEYLDKYGPHIIVTLKADYNPDALAVTEKVLLKADESIFRIRELLKGFHPWIEKVDMWNSKKQLLRDDQRIDECGLSDDLVIIIKSPIFRATDPINLDNSSAVETSGATETDIKIVSGDEEMRLRNMFSFLSPIIEKCSTRLDEILPEGQSNMSKLMEYSKKDYNEVANENPDFSKLISGMFTDFDKIEKNVSKEETQAGLNLFLSGIHEPPDDKESSMTLQQGYQSAQEIFEKCCAINERNTKDKMNPVEKQLICNVMNELFKSIEKDEEVKNSPDKIVNGKIMNYMNNFLENILKTEGPVDGEEIVAQLRSNLDENKEKLGFDVNSIINDFWTMLQGLNNMACQNVNVIPNLNKDDAFRISSGFQLTTEKIMKSIPVSENTKEMHLTTTNYDTFYDDNTTLTKHENITLLTVSKLDNLEIMETLGKGAYGEVKKCRNKTNNEIHALKIIETNNEKLKKINELIPEIFANFKIAIHSRIIKYFDYYKEENKFFIEMEYMEGGSLRDYLLLNKKLNEIEIRHFSLQILEGLKYLQRKSLLHGDMKPENILLDKDKNVKITDFGFAKDCDSLTTFSEGGTERYQAPEIATGEQLGTAIDIWAFGIIVMEMVLGDSLNESNEDSLMNIKNNKDNSRSLCYFIEYSLKEHPKERWTASELIESSFIKYDIDE